MWGYNNRKLTLIEMRHRAMRKYKNEYQVNDIFMCINITVNGMLPLSNRCKENGTPVLTNSISKNTTQLTDKDIFGNETTLSVSEEDIQAALDGEDFYVPLNSAVILVQSGNRAPEMLMQQEMAKYYRISTFSGIPDKQK
ncbi:lipoprotein [Salmonella enterica subsp. enterica serovar Sanjuan]|uniref:Lipoprotein n=1 Tax=Salmonella enterica subsp. enterica serovar Sanjuan TaxID=1160765 RepID=A0A3S4EP05_SALET|nr:lipoprotein [Salmonella enterica subsp. enterica serovar Sanjuan]